MVLKPCFSKPTSNPPIPAKKELTRYVISLEFDSTPGISDVSRRNSAISAISQSSAAHTFAKTSVVTFSFFASFAIEARLIPAASRNSCFCICMSFRRCQSLSYTIVMVSSKWHSTKPLYYNLLISAIQNSAKTEFCHSGGIAYLLILFSFPLNQTHFWRAIMLWFFCFRDILIMLFVTNSFILFCTQ